MNFAYRLRDEIKRDVFSQKDLKAVLYPMSDVAVHSGITRSLNSKEFLRLKRGLYLFSKDLRRGSISKFLIANKLYNPSYVSFESALSHYGLIPEAVYTTTSACFQRKNKTFSNKLGDFTFDHIPVKNFYMGVVSNKEERGVLIASPLRALFDLIYFRKKDYENFEELYADLRIDEINLKKELAKIPCADLASLAKSYRKKNVYKFYEMLVRTFK
jgi:hypothetical protein